MFITFFSGVFSGERMTFAAAEVSLSSGQTHDILIILLGAGCSVYKKPASVETNMH